MFIREDLGMTLGSAATALAEQEESNEHVRVAPEDIRIILDAPDQTFVFGEKSVPVTENGLDAFGALLQVPNAFMGRLMERASKPTQQALLTDLLRATLQRDARVLAGETGLLSIEEWGTKDPITRRQVVDVAVKVLGEDAPVVRWVDSAGMFSFDAHVTEDHGQGRYSDGVTAYADGNEQGDITAGGLRFGLNTKAGLVPTTQEILHRLACTNGMTIERSGLKIEGRGQTVEEVLADLERVAEAAFSHVEDDMRHFYDLKNTRVENPERALRTIARERSIPDRSVSALMDLAVTDALPDDVSMFDIVNLVTNFANSPGITRDGGRLILEGAGGAVISEHGKASRCGHCQQKVHA